MKGKDAPPPPPIPANATPAQKKKMQATIDNYDNDVPPPPAPPAPKSPLDHVIEMAKKGATFYYEGNLISSDEAIQLLKINNERNISTKQVDSKEPKVYISKEPIGSNKQTKTDEIVMLNGEKSKNGSYKLKKDQVNNLELTISEGTIKEFKFKLPGKQTVSVKGNTLNEEAKLALKDALKKDGVQLFMIKNSDNAVHPPIFIKIK
jgi:hypothetical protein